MRISSLILRLTREHLRLYGSNQYLLRYFNGPTCVDPFFCGNISGTFSRGSRSLQSAITKGNALAPGANNVTYSADSDGYYRAQTLDFTEDESIIIIAEVNISAIYSLMSGGRLWLTH